MGIMMLMAGKSWDLDARFDDRTDFWSIPGVNRTGLRNDNSIVSFTTQISDPTWSFGFINDVGEYVERVPPGSSQGASEFEPGDYANFAIEKNGNVVEFDRMFDTVVPSQPHTPGDADLVEFPGSSALTTYYNRLDLFFGNASLPHVTIDATPFSNTDGFALTVPEPASMVILTGFAVLLVRTPRRTSR